jgi:plasmid stability protein
MKKEKQLGSMIIRNIPEVLRREFKSQCASEGKSMQEKVIELIEKYTEKAGGKNGR